MAYLDLFLDFKLGILTTSSICIGSIGEKTNATDCEKLMASAFTIFPGFNNGTFQVEPVGTQTKANKTENPNKIALF